jgi:predicted DNA-binding protein (UPF0251 family)
MSRLPGHCRIEGKPIAPVCRPAGLPAHDLTAVVISLDEFEAVRLAELEGLHRKRR